MHSTQNCTLNFLTPEVYLYPISVPINYKLRKYYFLSIAIEFSSTYLYLYYLYNGSETQNLFLTAQSTQIKSVISVPIKDFIHHYPRALFNDIPRVGAYFYDIPGSGRSLTTYPGQRFRNSKYIIVTMYLQTTIKYIEFTCLKG